MTVITTDNPINLDADDYLNRAPYAKGIADTIDAFEPKSSFRIGVYGGWGEGKTSVLKLVEAELIRRGHYTIWLPPWGAESSDELLNALLQSVGQKLELSKTNSVLAFANKNVSAVRAGVSEAGGVAGAIASTFGSMVETALKKKFSGSIRNDLLPSISDALGEKKLIVFVDDLDRARPEIIPEFLMALRELLNLPDFHFVLGLAPEIVHEGLQQLHRGWSQVESFLEKIIELPSYLPIPQKRDIKAFAHSQIASLGDCLSLSAINSISDLLPSNPRKLKLLLRSLAGLSQTLGRFSPNEIDVATVYVCQMLRFEFPRESTALIADTEALNAMEHARIGILFEKKNIESDAQLREYTYRPEKNSDRFLLLCQFLRSERPFIHGEYTLTDMLTIRENPPVITWEETSRLLAEFHSAAQMDRVALIRRFLGSENVYRLRLKSLFNRVMGARNNLLEQAAGETLVQQVDARIEDAEVAGELLTVLISDIDCFAEAATGAEEWRSLYNQVLHWNQWKAYPSYGRARELELNILRVSADRLPADVQIAVWNDLELADSWEDSAPRGELRIEVEKIRTKFVKTTFSAILSAFEQPGAIFQLLRRTQGGALSRALMEPGKGFFSEFGPRDSIKSLSMRAHDDSCIHNNFFDLLSTMIWGAYSPESRFVREGLKQILQESTLISVLWEGALARPVNRRNMNSMLQYRAQMISDGIPEQFMPIPLWHRP